MGPFKGEVPVFARLWTVGVRMRVSFTTRAVVSAILATAGLFVPFWYWLTRVVPDRMQRAIKQL